MKTIIQLKDKVPYTRIAEHNFLYQPIQRCALKINGKSHYMEEIIDTLDENGDITRYVRFSGVGTT